MSLLVYLRGGGDLASGVALRLHRVGLRVIISELAQPLVVRRLVSFANAIFEGRTRVEEVYSQRIEQIVQAFPVLEQGEIPVIIDPLAQGIAPLRAAMPSQGRLVLVDARMTKRPPDLGMDAADFVIGLGPGFTAGVNCHAAIETNRGHLLGRVIWDGSPQADTGVPEYIARHSAERVLRAPADGVLKTYSKICDLLEIDQLVAEVDGQPVRAPFSGVLRGIVYPGLRVSHGMKIGDVDPRGDPDYCRLVSDKALAIGAGVLEALLSRAELRPYLWS